MIIYLAAWLLFNVQIVLGLSSLKGGQAPCVKTAHDYTNNYSNKQKKCSDLDEESHDCTGNYGTSVSQKQN